MIGIKTSCRPIDQFRYIRLQSQTIDLRTWLWWINPTNSVVIPQSLVLKLIVWGWILIYWNWSIRSVIILVINKSDSRFAVVRFCYHSSEWLQTETPLSPDYHYCQFILAFKVARSDFWVTIPFNFEGLEPHHYQSNRKSNVSGVLEKDESWYSRQYFWKSNGAISLRFSPEVIIC